MYDEITIQLPHINIAAKTWGKPSLPPVLALHGWLDNAASFDLLAPQFNDRFFVAIDLPGHGLSGHRGYGELYYLVDYIKEVIAVIDYFAWQECDLVGHSLGGSIGCLTAACFPERIKHLVLLDAIGSLAKPASETVKQLKKSILAWQQLFIQETGYYSSVADMISIRARNTGLSKTEMTLIVERDFKKSKQGYIWRHDPQLKLPSPLYLTEEQVFTALQHITCETLLLHAIPGYGFDPLMIKHRCSYIQKIQYYPIESHHYPHLSKPNEVAKLINNLIA